MTTAQLYRWVDVADERVTETLSRRIVTGEREMVAQITMRKGCVVPRHSHESEQMTCVFKGSLKFVIEGREIVVGANEILHIPSGVPHEAVALEDVFEMDVFSPIRQDWLDHTDDYFRR